MSHDNESMPPDEGEARNLETRAFAREEMITCNECLRANAPTRDTCLYCSAALPQVASGQSPTGDQQALRELGLTDGVKPEDEPAPKRIRALEFTDEFLIASVTGARDKQSAAWDEFVLLVSGRLIISRVELEQPKSRRNKKPAERREFSSDDAVFDLYTKTLDGGWRIGASSFDFSCLGPGKSALSLENFGTLINTIRARARNVAFNEGYAQARKALAEVWPVEQRSESQGWRRAGAGKFSLTTATVKDNEAQFTRYSQLRHHLRLQELDPSK